VAGSAWLNMPQTSLVSRAVAPTTVLQAVLMPTSLAVSPVKLGAEPE
jgi:hypothetical protein